MSKLTKEQEKIRKAAYRARYPDKVKVYQLNYYKLNRERLIKKEKDYRDNNREEFRARRRKYRANSKLKSLI